LIVRAGGSPAVAMTMTSDCPPYFSLHGMSSYHREHRGKALV
jgi:hypothetical protein